MALRGPTGDICVPCWIARQGDYLALAVSMRPPRRAVNVDALCTKCLKAAGRPAAQKAAAELADQIADVIRPDVTP